MTQLQKLLKTKQPSIDECVPEAEVPALINVHSSVAKHLSQESEAISPDFGGPSGKNAKVSPKKKNSKVLEHFSQSKVK